MITLWLHYMHAYSRQLLMQLTQQVLLMLYLGGDHLDTGGPDSDFGNRDVISLGGLARCDLEFGSHDIMWPRLWSYMV